MKADILKKIEDLLDYCREYGIVDLTTRVEDLQRDLDALKPKKAAPVKKVVKKPVTRKKKK